MFKHPCLPRRNTSSWTERTVNSSKLRNASSCLLSHWPLATNHNSNSGPAPPITTKSSCQVIHTHSKVNQSHTMVISLILQAIWALFPGSIRQYPPLFDEQHFRDMSNKKQLRMRHMDLARVNYIMKQSATHFHKRYLKHSGKFTFNQTCIRSFSFHVLWMIIFFKFDVVF